MSKFRKKPVVIDAVKFVPGQPVSPIFALDPNGTISDNIDHLAIATLEGVMRADAGDWIIRGVKGELYPCKPDIFAATYEPVE
jgi:hypothetical protein